MSRSIGKQCLLKTFAKQHYGTVAPASKSALSASTIETHVTSKKFKLVTCNENDPVVKISFTFKAGSRFENPQNVGINHVLRKAVGLSTFDVYPFNIMRNLQQYGVNLYSYTDRENYTVTVESQLAQLPAAFYYVNTIATKPVFKPWEISDNQKRILLELLTIPPETRTIDNLHAAAYRDGLGNSLFTSEKRVGQIDNNHLMEYFNKHCTGPRLQITASGISLASLNELVTEVEVDEEAGPSTPSQKYHGGENRVFDASEHYAYIAIAGETPGYTKKEYVSFAVLKHLLANPPSTPHGSSQGILNRALSKTGVLGCITGFNAAYSDSGLVGFFAILDPSHATKALDSIMDAFLKADVTENDLKRAKAQLKASIFTSVEGSKCVDFFANQTGQNAVVSPEQLASAADSLTTGDVKQALKKVLDGKLSMACYGNICQVPYLDNYKK